MESGMEVLFLKKYIDSSFGEWKSLESLHLEFRPFQENGDGDNLLLWLQDEIAKL